MVTCSFSLLSFISRIEWLSRVWNVMKHLSVFVGIRLQFCVRLSKTSDQLRPLFSHKKILSPSAITEIFSVSLLWAVFSLEETLGKGEKQSKYYSWCKSLIATAVLQSPGTKRKVLICFFFKAKSSNCPQFVGEISILKFRPGSYVAFLPCRFR